MGQMVERSRPKNVASRQVSWKIGGSVIDRRSFHFYPPYEYVCIDTSSIERNEWHRKSHDQVNWGTGLEIVHTRDQQLAHLHGQFPQIVIEFPAAPPRRARNHSSKKWMDRETVFVPRETISRSRRSENYSSNRWKEGKGGGEEESCRNDRQNCRVCESQVEERSDNNR